MEKADLPIVSACEPSESAKLPNETAREMPPYTKPSLSKKLTFTEDTDYYEKSSSQRSISYKEVLSQPDTNLSHRQKLQWLQKRRTAGLWVQCDECDRWRYLSGVLDRHELPTKWYCRMNPDTAFASCDANEAAMRVRDEEDLIHSEYSCGSLVWARLAGWPRWPAMVDDCPDAEQYYWLDGFSDIPTHYNVVFFDSTEVTRAWIAPSQVQPYSSYKGSINHLSKNKMCQQRLKTAIAQAEDAMSLPLDARLAKYSFISRHKGQINSPKNISKNDLKRYQRKFQNKYNVNIPVESSESEEDVDVTNQIRAEKRKNVIMLGTPKSAKKTKIVRKLGEEIDLLKEQNEVVEQPLDSEVLKTNSLAAQVGSAVDTGITNSIDNDTSEDYVPPSGAGLPATKTTDDFTIRIETPNSDDFDF